MNDSGASASSLVEVWEVEKQGGEKKIQLFYITWNSMWDYPSPFSVKQLQESMKQGQERI